MNATIERIEKQQIQKSIPPSTSGIPYRFL